MRARGPAVLPQISPNEKNGHKWWFKRPNGFGGKSRQSPPSRYDGPAGSADKKILQAQEIRTIYISVHWCKVILPWIDKINFQMIAKGSKLINLFLLLANLSFHLSTIVFEFFCTIFGKNCHSSREHHWGCSAGNTAAVACQQWWEEAACGWQHGSLDDVVWWCKRESGSILLWYRLLITISCRKPWW